MRELPKDDRRQDLRERLDARFRGPLMSFFLRLDEEPLPLFAGR